MELSYYASGTATGRPPVVILHGLFGSGRNWLTISRRLSQRHLVYALDLRNHGDSPWDDEISYPILADDVDGFLDEHGLGRVAFIGHSMGGKTAMWLALTRPQRVARLLVADIAPVAYPDRLSPYFEAMRSVPLDSLERRGDADPYLAAVEPDEKTRAFLMQNLRKGESGAWGWRCHLEALDAELLNLVGWPDPPAGARYDGPTLFLRGGASDYVDPARQGAAIDALFPAARHAVIDGAGHRVHSDAPDAFLREAEAFLDAPG